MNISSSKPLVCVSCSLTQMANGRFQGHSTSQKNVDAVAQFADCTPLLLPARGDGFDPLHLIPHIDGLVLTGGRANVQPHHYGGPPFPDDEVVDPSRDATALAMVRACVEHEIPIFGICRGIQELNVALGGTLHYRLHLVPGMDDHRMPRRDDITPDEIFKLRHPVTMSPGGLFAEITGKERVMVNSLHGQGIDRVADSLEVEAVTDDGVVEGVRLRNDPGFTVGVQWHAEWKPGEHELSRGLFKRFGEAARKRATVRTRVTVVHSSVA